MLFACQCQCQCYSHTHTNTHTYLHTVRSNVWPWETTTMMIMMSVMMRLVVLLLSLLLLFTGEQKCFNNTKNEKFVLVSLLLFFVSISPILSLNFIFWHLFYRSNHIFYVFDHYNAIFTVILLQFFFHFFKFFSVKCCLTVCNKTNSQTLLSWNWKIVFFCCCFVFLFQLSGMCVCVYICGSEVSYISCSI